MQAIPKIATVTTSAPTLETAAETMQISAPLVRMLSAHRTNGMT